MVLNNFKGNFFSRYIDSSYEAQQKAYLLYWMCFWGAITGFVFVAVNTVAAIGYTGEIPLIRKVGLIGEIFLVAWAFIGAYFIWNKQYRIIIKITTLMLFLLMTTTYVLSLGRFTDTGIFTHRENFYVLLAWVSLFSNRKILIILGAFIVIGTTLHFLGMKPDFNSSTNFIVNIQMLIGNRSFIVVTILLFFSTLINGQALNTARIELEKNKELNRNLDQKVKERTLELNQKNDELQNIEDSLKKYLPVQLVNTIKLGKKGAIPETERRKLTVFFSDIKGFTEATEALEAEELSILLNEYLTEMTIIAHKCGGTVDKFIGDAIMIFFGAPERTPDKDNALNCVKMAIEMQEKMKDLQSKWFNEGFENPIHIRIGISTGTSTVGNFGAEDRLSYTVIGGQVNIAARLEGICQPDEIMISHPTWAFVKDGIECTPGEKVSVKGINREIMTYKVLKN